MSLIAVTQVFHIDLFGLQGVLYMYARKLALPCALSYSNSGISNCNYQPVYLAVFNCNYSYLLNILSSFMCRSYYNVHK